LDEPPSQVLLSIFSGVNLMYTISFAAIAVLLVVSALVSASEVAFFSLKADDLDKCRQSNGKKDKIIIDLLSKPRLLLASILILNNTVNVAVVTISTFLMWEMVGTRNPTEFVVGIVTFIVTFAITFFGEIIPKVYATKNNLNFALFMSGTWKVLIKICVPVSRPLLSFGKVIEKQFEKK
jgi:putative hemolysin